MSLKNVNSLNPNQPKRVAIVISNPAVSISTSWPVGFWWSELTHPYYEFTEAGYEVELFSPNGGKCEADAMSDPRDPSGYSASDLISMGFIATSSLAGLVANTCPVADLDMAQFDAIVVAGGQAPMSTFEQATTLHANVEEDFADNAVWDMGLLSRDKHVMPWRIEDEMKRLGANYIQAGLWKGFAVRDGNLITGQQNFSGAETAKAVIEALGR
jgi:putative intracellular protease/amidase